MLTNFLAIALFSVGALVTKTTGTAVSLTSGKTAPWAEIAVVDSSSNIVSIAEVDSSGAFDFNFNAAANSGGLFVFATDQIGQTSKVLVPNSGLFDFILPPTLVSLDEASLPDNTVKFAGYTYPKSTVIVTLRGPNKYFNTFSSTPDQVSGKWELQEDNLRPGDYEANAVSFYNGEKSNDSNTLFFKVKGSLSAVNNITSLIQNLPEPVKASAKTLSKAGVPVAASWLLFQAFLSGMQIKDVASYGLLGFYSVTGVFKRKKGEKWGIIYDAITKNALSGVVVRLYDAKGTLIETDVTNKYGFYSFLPPEGKYKIKVVKPGYFFPSRLVTGFSDGEYRPLYHSQEFEITSKNPVVNLDIALDPKNYSRLEGRMMLLKQISERYLNLLTPLLAIVGLIFSTIAYILNPIAINLIIILFYILTGFYIFTKKLEDRGVWGKVIDQDGNAVFYLPLSLLDTVFGRQLQRRVTDASGKFTFLAPKGKYTITITSPDWKIINANGGYSGGVIEQREDRDYIKPKIVVKKG